MIALMNAISFDVLDDRLSVPRANVVCNTSGKILKTIELQFKYGTPRIASAKEKVLLLG